MEKKKINKAINMAIDNVILEGCTDVDTFNRPFELDLLKKENYRENIKNEISKMIDDILNQGKDFTILKINKIPNMLVPKKNYYDFRKCALVDIVDEIKYLSLAILIAPEIEKCRVKKDMAFSYRYNPDKGRLFDKNYNYSSFKKKYKTMAAKKSYKVMIECDIANFYDRLNLHRLNSTLLSIDTIDPIIAKTLDELLLFWSNRDSYGLPVGSNASRILAEAFLIEIDNYLISHKIKFCRFVDDYRFFAKNVIEANKILNDFVNILNKHGAAINTRKTLMKDISNFQYIGKSGKKKTREGLSEIIRGYSGIVPTKFRNLSASEKKKLQREDEKSLLKKLKSESIIEAPDVTKCLRILIAKENYDELAEFPKILSKYPQLIPYYSSALNKVKSLMNEDQHKTILTNFNEWITNQETPEYILINIIRLYDKEIEEDVNSLFDFFKELKRNSGIYIGRTILDQISDKLKRGQILELKDYFLRADIWEKRKIVEIAFKKLSLEENRPFCKDLLINSNDEILLNMANEFRKAKK